MTKGEFKPTSISLLNQVISGEDDSAWQRLHGLYAPMIRNWLSRQQIVGAEADDLAQDVLVVVLRKLPSFEHNGRAGAFRKWLRMIVVNCSRDFWSSKRIRPASPGSTQFLNVLNSLGDDSSELTQKWNQDHDVYVMKKLMKDVQALVEPVTWQAFQLTSVEGKSPAEAAQQLKIAVGSVYTAKSRVLSKLRALAENLIDE